jgi:hypothetical protein
MISYPNTCIIRYCTSDVRHSTSSCHQLHWQGCHSLMVKASGWQSFGRLFEPYLCTFMAASLWCGLGGRSRTDFRRHWSRFIFYIGKNPDAPPFSESAWVAAQRTVTRMAEYNLNCSSQAGSSLSVSINLTQSCTSVDIPPGVTGLWVCDSDNQSIFQPNQRAEAAQLGNRKQGCYWVLVIT